MDDAMVAVARSIRLESEIARRGIKLAPGSPSVAGHARFAAERTGFQSISKNKFGTAADAHAAATSSRLFSTLTARILSAPSRRLPWRLRRRGRRNRAEAPNMATATRARHKNRPATRRMIQRRPSSSPITTNSAPSCIALSGPITRAASGERAFSKTRQTQIPPAVGLRARGAWTECAASRTTCRSCLKPSAKARRF
jgi:hypothetical protein